MEIWNALNDDWMTHYYLSPLMCLIEIVFIITALIRPIHEKRFILIVLMTFTYVIANLLNYYLIVLEYNFIPLPFPKGIYFSIVCIFLLITFFILSYFQLKTTNNHVFKKFTKWAQILLTVFAIIEISIFYDFNKSLPNFSFLSAFSSAKNVFLLPGSFIFFYELIHTKHPKNIFNDPDFWVHTAIITYSIGSMPLYFVTTIAKSHPLNIAKGIMIFSLYILMFLIFIKAYLCQRHRLK